MPRRVEGAEPDVVLVELIDEGDELAGAAAEPIEVEDDEDVAVAEVVLRQAARFGRLEAAPEDLGRPSPVETRA